MDRYGKSNEWETPTVTRVVFSYIVRARKEIEENEKTLKAISFDFKD